ncbi:MAG: DUF2480 family protein [Bacteroidetes bacterium]|nr:DUF2480 family protein [Bacteroidota bacterium]
MEEPRIVNRVANSTLVTLNLEDYLPNAPAATVDLKQVLFQELILKEKDLRDFIKTHDWSQYSGKNVNVYCSVDVIVPTWAYMLVGISLQPFAKQVFFGTKDSMHEQLLKEALDKLDWEKFRDAKVVIKGCSDVHVPESAYLEVATRLRPIASSIMYGEPCSTVPLYKRNRAGD